mmetsp:Transcript_115293/g.359049  ORF Transcript_115293/g.359049 Transcript_115293/m.359049 type:complete len:178 (-) Transcript_115293:77-610(-)
MADDSDNIGAATGWDGVGYKVVAKVGQRYLSVWAGDGAEYVLGLRKREQARPRHAGGLYVCRSPEAAARHRIPARRGGLFTAPRVLLRCLCEGPFVEYPGGKVACSSLTPLQELQLPFGYLHSAPSPSPGGRAVRPLPARPLSPAALTSGRPSSAMRRETEALEAEVADLERRLGYR